MRFSSFLPKMVFLLMPYSLPAQVNDKDAFYFGTYDKEIIRSHKIKEIKISNFINAEFSSNAIYQFDINGYLLKILRHDTSKNIIKEIVFEYNSNGDQQSLTENDFVNNKKYENIFYKLYEDNKLIFDSSGSLGIAKRFIYNDSGKIKTMTTFMASSYAIGKYDYSYCENGLINKSTESMLFPDGSIHLLKTKYYFYNNNNQLFKTERSNSATHKFSYYNDGLLKSKLTVMPEEFSKIEIMENYLYLFWK